MNELRVCIESTQATNEELLSAWFTLPIDEEEFLEKLGIDAESENYRIVDKALPFSDDVREDTSVERLNDLYSTYASLPADLKEDCAELLCWFTDLDELHSHRHDSRGLGEITHENLVGNGHWQTRTVAKILRAEVYTGDLVQGVSKIIDHKQVRASADEWTTVRGTHDAIISRELFAAVQKALDQAAQQAKDREIHSWSPNLLRGKIFCAHCGRSLHRQKCVRRKSQEVYVYHCISNNRIKKGVCPGAFIFEKELLDALADMIQEQLDTTLGQYSLGLENLTKEAEEQKNIEAKILSRKQEIQQLRTYQRGLYEGLIQNHLSKDEYFTFKEKYEAKIEAISKEIEQLKAGLAIIAKQLEQYKMLSQDAQYIKEDRQLTAALIDRLIDRVEVSREKRITVRFRFQSEFEHCEEVLSQCRNM